MQAPHLHSIQGQNLWLSHERGIFWEQERALIVSDLHFGKTGHFRKSGIPVPQHVYKHDLQRLIAMIQFFQPDKLIVVGDLFHSRENKELELFLKWRQDFPHLVIELIMGNHDILHKSWYRQAAISISPKALRIKDFNFRHDLEIPGLTIPEVPIVKVGKESRTVVALDPQNTRLPDISLGRAEMGRAEMGKAEMGKADIVRQESPLGLEETPSYLFSGHIHPGIAIRGLGKQSLRFPCFYFTEKFCVLPAFSRFTGTFLIEPNDGEQVFAIVDNRLMPMHN